MTTIYEYTATASNCSTNGGDAYEAGTGTNSDYLFTQIFNDETGYGVIPFTRTTYATVGGTTYYLFAPVYITDDYDTTNSGNPNHIRFGESNDTPANNTMIIYPDCFSSGHIDTNATSSNPQYIYLKLFDESGNSRNVALEYAGGTTQLAVDWYPELGQVTHYVFNFLPQTSDPVCLTDTCDILTPNGYVNVKDLSVGDLVTTPEGKNVKITKVMKPTTHVAMGKALPHFIPKNSLGENKPSKDTFIAKNHAYKSGDEWLCGQFNIEHNAINWDQDFVTYYNIMTEDYPKHTLVVNGVEMESWGGYEHNKPETHGNIKLRREKLGFKLV